MKPSVIALISAESAQVARTFGGVQNDISPNGYSGDSSAENVQTADAINVESVQIIQEPVSDACLKVTESTTQGLFSKLKKLLWAASSPKQPLKDELITPRHHDTAGGSESLNSKDADVLKARKRNAELERIERFKTGGM